MALLSAVQWVDKVSTLFNDGGEATAAEFREVMGDLSDSIPFFGGISIERLYDGESLLAVQQPSSLNTPLELQFGTVQGTGSDPIQTLANVGSEASILQINESGLYRIKTAIQYGRLTGAQVAILNFRALVNGVQAGRSINQRLETSNQTSLFTDEAWLYLPAGIQITYQVIRDSNGNNSGGLIAGETSGSTGWNHAPTMSLRVERFVRV